AELGRRAAKGRLTRAVPHGMLEHPHMAGPRVVELENRGDVLDSDVLEGLFQAVDRCTPDIVGSKELDPLGARPAAETPIERGTNLVALREGDGRVVVTCQVGLAAENDGVPV